MPWYLLVLLSLFCCQCQSEDCRVYLSPDGQQQFNICRYMEDGKSYSMLYLSDVSTKQHFHQYAIPAHQDYLKVRNKGRDGAWSLLLEWQLDGVLIYTAAYKFEGQTGTTLFHYPVNDFIKRYHSTSLTDSLLRIDQ